MDSRFRVEIVRLTPNPQQAVWAAMHQDYSEDFVVDFCHEWPGEEKAGELVVKHLLAGNKGHWGPCEHVQIILNVGYFPHSFMQQLSRHRVGISFDCQSFRYTGTRILDVVKGDRDVEEVFYLRPVGKYYNRQGKHYEYTADQREDDLEWCELACGRYYQRVQEGVVEEHARGLIPFDVRQHFMLSCNMRSLMHLLDLRWKKDAQLEAQQFCDLLFKRFKEWSPAVAAWYFDNRAKKARLAP
ncbi:MAG: FAD-dependent thymidylate synthase [Cyanobacteria bacterium P01_F01_bin.150]